MDDGRVTTGLNERSAVTLDPHEVVPPPPGPAPRTNPEAGSAPAPAPGAGSAGGTEAAPGPVRSSRRGHPPWRQVVAAIAVLATLVGAATVRRAAADASQAATGARAEAAQAADQRSRVEAEVEDRLVALDATYAEAFAAGAAREAQRDRLVELQLAEETLEEEVAAARRDTEAVEAERAGLDDRVQQQAADLPQLEGCLAEVRPLVDTAFLATVNPGLVVPSVSPACRALLAAVGEDP